MGGNVAAMAAAHASVVSVMLTQVCGWGRCAPRSEACPPIACSRGQATPSEGIRGVVSVSAGRTCSICPSPHPSGLGMRNLTSGVAVATTCAAHFSIWVVAPFADDMRRRLNAILDFRRGG